jgi:tRNA(Ile)-lysidine synthase
VLAAQFAEAMERVAAPWPAAVAVSGGGDSLALMHLLADWAKKQRRDPPVVLTVDHKLQKRSTANARQVQKWAKDAGLKARILTWTGARPRADIEAEARQARYRLMGAWCEAHGITALYVGHTRDDQAETFLLRLARGSGLDGLAAMRPVAGFPVEKFKGLQLVRPLIDLGRDALRAHLTARGQPWIEDPMNSDPQFGRVRIRAAMGSLQAAGLTTARIADAAAHLGRAREALDIVTAAVLRRACRTEGNAILVEAGALTAAPREVGLRTLARLLMGVSGQAYRPRFERLERLFEAIADRSLGKGRTLHGCRIGPAPGSRAFFGTDTLIIAPETARSVPKSLKMARSDTK